MSFNNSSACTKTAEASQKVKRTLKAKQSKTFYKKKVSPFLRRLREILDDQSNRSICGWSESAETGSFTIFDPERFSNEILVRYFRHGCLKNFIRQLNIHGFKKLHLQKSTYISTNSSITYTNHLFVKDHEAFHILIRRRVHEFDDEEFKSMQREGLEKNIRDLEKTLVLNSTDPVFALFKSLQETPAVSEVQDKLLESMRILKLMTSSDTIMVPHSELRQMVIRFVESLGHRSGRWLLHPDDQETISTKDLCEEDVCTVDPMPELGLDPCKIQEFMDHSCWLDQSDTSSIFGNLKPSLTTQEEEFLPWSR